ncbi:permease prefix domain 1-containing protein [Pseudonocardia zijingensis]|uniref:Uncharacterized protein n=1 Tax=Pseudonocardia zijingensis TaxID=153376 RepID=A0ABN1QT71_9PSEU
MTAAPDLVAAHVAELDRALRGPAAAKRSMLTEVRHGLADAVADHRERGLDERRAAAAAVHDFGPVHAVAPLMQEELTARQGRRTALLLAVVFPAELLAWDVLWWTGHGWSQPPTTQVMALARAVDALSVLVAATALVLLLATFRRAPLPGRVTGATGLLAVLGVAGCGGLSVVMNLLSSHPAGPAGPVPPAVGVVGAATLVVVVLVTRSAVRALRSARAARGSDQGAHPKVG